MKTLLSLLVAVGLTFGLAAAQDLSGNSNSGVSSVKPGVDVNGFKAPSTLAPYNPKASPNVHPSLKPRLGGVIPDGATKYGAELINPFAPDYYGNGEKYLSAPSSTYDLKHESGYAAHRQAGGIKLFSLEF